MTGWRIVDCNDLRGEIHSRRGQLLIRREGRDDEAIPTEDLAVLLIGNAVAIGRGVLQRCAEDDVVVLASDWRGRPAGGLYKWSGHSRVGARHRAQAALSEPRRKQAWARIVRAKVLGQSDVLTGLGRPDGVSLRRLSSQVRSGDQSNVEATAARRYWGALFGGMMVRSPGQRTDDINSCLDYGYAILRGVGVRAVLAAGLEPGLGVFHRGRSNPFNLVDDLIEPWRPAVDWAVATSPWSLSLTNPDVKHRLVSVMSTACRADGVSVAGCLHELAHNFGMYVEGEIDILEVSAWAFPRDVYPVAF